MRLIQFKTNMSGNKKIICFSVIAIFFLADIPVVRSANDPFSLPLYSYESSKTKWVSNDCVYPDGSLYTPSTLPGSTGPPLQKCEQEKGIAVPLEVSDPEQRFTSQLCQSLFFVSQTFCSIKRLNIKLTKSVLDNTLNYTIIDVCVYASSLVSSGALSGRIKLDYFSNGCESFCSKSDIKPVCQLLISGLCQYYSKDDACKVTMAKPAGTAGNDATGTDNLETGGVGIAKPAGTAGNDATGTDNLETGGVGIDDDNVTAKTNTTEGTKPVVTTNGVDRIIEKMSDDDNVTAKTNTTEGNPSSSKAATGEAPAGAGTGAETPVVPPVPSAKNIPKTIPKSENQGGSKETDVSGITTASVNLSLTESAAPPDSGLVETTVELSQDSKPEVVPESKIAPKNSDDSVKEEGQTGPVGGANSKAGESEDVSKKTIVTEKPQVPPVSDSPASVADENEHGSDEAYDLVNSKQPVAPELPTSSIGGNKNSGGFQTVEETVPSSGHFFAYFLTAVVICISGYVIFHNKQKILAFIVEGRTADGGRRRGNGTVEYTKLRSNVEEVMPALDKATKAQNFVY